MTKKVVLSTVAALALCATSAFAADLGGRIVTKAPPPPPPSPWDLAFGAGIASDYEFRGITQSDHKPSVNAYFEPRYNVSKDLQLYAGIAGESIDFPNRAAAEIDLYGGIRPTFGPLALDIGFIYYWYPGGQEFNGVTTPALPNGNIVKQDLSWYEPYVKALWTINDSWAVGANFFYTPSYLNSGADGEYLSGTLKYTFASGVLPNGIGAYISGELGHQWLGTTDSFYANTPLPDYTTWNVGLAFTWKVFTLDLRYWDTDLSKADCNVITGDHTAGFDAGSVTPTNPLGLASSWCGATFVAKLSADLTLDSLK
jgi:uncharacterized protein (TIGR02001 family)